MNRFKQLAYSAVALAPAGLPVTGTPVTLTEIQDRIQQAAQFLIIVAMVIAVIMIVYGGIRYMMSPSDAKDAKAIIKNGIIGAAIVLAVGVILQTVAG